MEGAPLDSVLVVLQVRPALVEGEPVGLRPQVAVVRRAAGAELDEVVQLVAAGLRAGNPVCREDDPFRCGGDLPGRSDRGGVAALAAYGRGQVRLGDRSVDRTRRAGWVGQRLVGG